MSQCTKKIPQNRNKEVWSSVEMMAILKALLFQGGRILGSQCFFFHDRSLVNSTSEEDGSIWYCLWQIWFPLKNFFGKRWPLMDAAKKLVTSVPASLRKLFIFKSTWMNLNLMCALVKKSENTGTFITLRMLRNIFNNGIQEIFLTGTFVYVFTCHSSSQTV